MVAQIGLTDKHTDISHWTQSCHSILYYFMLDAHLNAPMNNLCTFSDKTQMWDEILINSPDQSCCVNLKCFQYFDKTLKKIDKGRHRNLNILIYSFPKNLQTF